ncbi:MAG: phosphate acyltransferase PlsX [Acidiferrobacterales bacterium]|nr:phosphate acyltransferase PlsX [Acidiferrobacterales bacterium]
MIRLSIDAMGGDLGIDATVPASIAIASQNPDVELILVGDESQIAPTLESQSATANISVRHASEVVDMNDSPSFALRKKKDSSMRVAINLVNDGEANACISSGNTGALMATARFVLKTIPGIERPAICSALPKLSGFTYMLDLGANIDSRSDILFQFGMMGDILVQTLEGKSSPSIGLLNIGVEELKGNDTIKAAAELFRSSDLNYQGFVEPNDIYLGDTDLIVCDGFIGNIALKASEGVAQMILGVVRDEFTRTAYSKGAALISKPVLNSIKKRLDHRRYNGASLLGLRGSVVKSHGGSDAYGFENAIGVALEEVREDLVARIENSFIAMQE